MRLICVSALAATLLFLGCSDDGSVTPDQGPSGDGPGQAETSVTDVGGQRDTKPPGDKGPVTDGGGSTDIGPITCDPSFGQAQACGGTLTGTKWKYVAGCVADSAFDALKTNCSGATVSNVAYSMTPNSTVQFFANGTLVRYFSGKITGKATFPQTCTRLGCTTLQSALALALLKYPGSTVTCTAATGGGCTCDVTINLFSFSGGSYTTSGNTVTVTVSTNQHPFYYCVAGNTLTYHGTPQNTNDQHVTYVLKSTP